jgi:hypothetical protein
VPSETAQQDLDERAATSAPAQLTVEFVEEVRAQQE